MDKKEKEKDTVFLFIEIATCLFVTSALALYKVVFIQVTHWSHLSP